MFCFVGSFPDFGSHTATAVVPRATSHTALQVIAMRRRRDPTGVVKALQLKKPETPRARFKVNVTKARQAAAVITERYSYYSNTVYCAFSVCMVTHIARVWINRVWLPILHVGQLKQGKIIFLCSRSRLKIWSRDTGLLLSILRLNLVLTTGFLPSSAAASIYLF